jgi:hypothetical protein
VNRLELDTHKLEPAARKELHKELGDARKDGDRLVGRLTELAKRVAAPRTDTLRMAGAAGGAEDLL